MWRLRAALRTYRKDEHNRGGGDGGVAEDLRACQSGGQKAQQSRDSDPKRTLSFTAHEINKTKNSTYSKTFEYNSFRTDTICTLTRSAPSGNAINESTKLPENETEQIAAEQNPPMMMSCHHEYIGLLRMSASRLREASDTEISSWMTCAKGSAPITVQTKNRDRPSNREHTRPAAYTDSAPTLA